MALERTQGVLRGSGDPNLDDSIKDGGGITPLLYIDESTDPVALYKFDSSQASGSRWTEDVGEVPTGLEALDEGNGIGWRLLGRTAANYGNIGLNAIDFSVSPGASGTLGATGNGSMSWGSENTASGDRSTTWGHFNSASALYSTAWGQNNTASGQRSTTWGQTVTASASWSTGWGNTCTASGTLSTVWGIQNTANSWGSTVLGHYATVGAGQTSGSIVSTDELFKIGNGTSTGARSNALKIYKNAVQVVGGITADAASLLTPEAGMIAYVTTTDGTFTSTGFWKYQNAAWSVM